MPQKKKTTKEYKEQIKKIFKDEYKILEEYISSNVPIKTLHTKCGNIWKIRPVDLLRANPHRCPKCYCKNGKSHTTKKKTHEQYLEEIKKKFKDEYKILGKYKNANTPISTQHTNCGHIWEIRPVDLLKKKANGCPICAEVRSYSYTNDEFKQKIKELGNGDYLLLNEYKNRKTKIKLLHLKCNNIWETTFNSFLHGHRCPFCQKNNGRRLTTDEFKKRVKKIFKDEYTVLGEYKNKQTKIEILHNLCGNSFSPTPRDFLKLESMCKVCSKKFQGEETIKKFLDKYGVVYEREKTFKKLKYIRNLRFDFYLKEYKIAIEFDGEQHFLPIRGKVELEKTKTRDEIKNKFCKKEKIKLIRISYKKIKIKKYLKKQLKKLGIILIKPTNKK
jgi:hypothetical protein